MSSKYVGIEEARKTLGDLIIAAQQGTDIILTRGRSHRPVARLTPYREDAMITYLATVDTGVIAGDTTWRIAVDECNTVTSDGERGVVDTPWARDLTAAEIEDRDWDALLAGAGWTVTGDWAAHDGYWTADVTRGSYVLTTTDTDLITWLTGPLTHALGGQAVAERTDGGVLITRLDVLRTLGEHEDGSITDGENGPVMWVEGDPYPLTPATA